MLEGSHCFVGSILLVGSRLREQGRSQSGIDGVGHIGEHEAAGPLQGPLTRQQHLQGAGELRASQPWLRAGLRHRLPAWNLIHPFQGRLPG